MKKLIYAFILISVNYSSFAHYNCSSRYEYGNIFNISKYEIEIPSSLDKYTMGFSSGIGSGISFKGITCEGNLEFYCISDRGPNYTIEGTDYAKHTIIFPRADYSPFIGTICITPEKSATLTQATLLKVNGQNITGLPTPESIAKDAGSIPANPSFKRLLACPKGFDPESIDMDAEGNFWIGDEYRPAIIKAQVATGEIIETFTPGNGLPDILKNCPNNRGFEALAVAPNGKIYAALESIMDFDGKAKNSANFIRIIELDPKTKQTKTFAYPFDKYSYTSPSRAKIGDLAAIDDTHFLLIEQGQTPCGMRNIVYIIDLANTTDISDIALPNGLPLEYGSISELSNIKFIKKSPIFNAPDYEWPHEKLEGLAIINPKTIAITNDNDFGFSMSINGINSHHVCGYNVDYNTQKLMRHKQETQDKVDLHIDRAASTEIWVIQLCKNLLDFMDSETNESLKPSCY